MHTDPISVDIDQLRELVKLAEATGLQLFQISEENFAIRITGYSVKKGSPEGVFFSEVPANFAGLDEI